MGLPRISVVTVSIRPGIFRVGRDQMEKQSFKDFEWIVVDGLYHERKDEVAGYMKDAKFPFRHVDDERGKNVKQFNLAHANNLGIKNAQGELIVWLQDFMVIHPEALAMFWDCYQENPGTIFTGVDSRFTAKGDIDPTNKIDVFQGKPWVYGKTDYINVRSTHRGRWLSRDSYDFEMNWAATPKSICQAIGGFYEEFDHGFGYDNTEFAFRAIQGGHQLMVDGDNFVEAINHRVLFPGEVFGNNEKLKHEKLNNEERFGEMVAAIESGAMPVNVGCL